MARLSIPRVQLSAMVLHGSDDRTLRRGPGHLENTALPGEAGNAVIAGHRDTFFRPLQHVRRGDDIFVDRPQGRVHYRVASLRVVNPRDLSVLEPTDDAVLTLITCYPFWVLGNAPDRFIVRATRVDPDAPAIEARPALDGPPVTAPRPQHGVAKVAAPGPRRDARRDAAGLSHAGAVALDDEGLVRQAVERFRHTYNARLVSRQEARPGGPLGFQACAISADDNRAAATCTESSRPAPDREPHIWTFTLARTQDGWAIEGIEHRDTP